VDVDCVLFLHDVTAQSPQRLAPEKLSELESVLRSIKSPAILVLNKVDLVDRKEILPLIDAYSKLFPFAAIVPLSALKGEGVDRLMDEVFIRLPEGPQYFPDDIPTDATERFLCAEIIREKVFFQTGQEIPYSTAVQVESFKEDEDKPLVTIHATIFLERPSQKGIVIGKGGEKLKSIGTAARKDIEQLLGIKVMLKLWVKIHKNWTQDERFLRELGL
jgi:GTP-binding protein Era